MKSLTVALTMALILGTVGISFAGNKPSLTYPQGVLVSSDSSLAMAEVSPWHKGALAYAAGKPDASQNTQLSAVTPWQKGALRYAQGILVTQQGNVATASTGKTITVSSADLK
ncbi:MAG TPA: hypothetical protein VK859_02520 [bacterium]|jgi:hypothetical protein|nr:hypothetical protein [bacterium]